jgi:hypothetical protein
MENTGSDQIHYQQPTAQEPRWRRMGGIPMPPLRSILLVTLLAVGGCEAHQPSFMSRVREDCAASDRWAWDLLDSLGHSKPSPKAGSPHASIGAPPWWPTAVSTPNVGHAGYTDAHAGEDGHKVVDGAHSSISAHHGRRDDLLGQRR